MHSKRSLKGLLFLLTIQFFMLVNRVNGNIDTQFTEDIFIFFWQNDGRMDFATLELAQLFHGKVSFLIIHSGDG